jgi:dephospho-CoA kinase
MHRWKDKTIIGLTGNIATGKSVVRKMLEQLGAYGIDADALAHRALLPDAPGYQPVIEAFGKWIVASDGTIDRVRLGRIVFNDADALAQLESIIHPLVFQGIDFLIRKAKQHVIVIEAIKLIEAGIAKECDSIWVTTTSPEIQIQRLIQNRGMKVSEARQRVNAQNPQSEKIQAADVVINNAGSFTESYDQVVAAWKKIIPVAYSGTRYLPTLPKIDADASKMIVIRAKPAHANLIAELYNRYALRDQLVTTEQVMAAFGEKAFLLLLAQQKVMGLMGWKVENLVACTTDIGLDSTIPASQALVALLTEMEKASHDLQCEASIVTVPDAFAKINGVWDQMGYQLRTPESITFPAWKEAALEYTKPGKKVYFKQLRMDRVLRPI